MNTNVLTNFEVGQTVADTLFGTMQDTLEGFVGQVNAEGFESNIASLLGELVVAFLVIWGVFWVTRKLIRAARATR